MACCGRKRDFTHVSDSCSYDFDNVVDGEQPAKQKRITEGGTLQKNSLSSIDMSQASKSKKLGTSPYLSDSALGVLSQGDDRVGNFAHLMSSAQQLRIILDMAQLRVDQYGPGWYWSSSSAAVKISALSTKPSVNMRWTLLFCTIPRKR
ncbi:hypothetical protein FXO37_24077 [Capsicum annuum]|nr:hypothetical protein FXO37_24077 [Capsicum annuum]